MVVAFLSMMVKIGNHIIKAKWLLAQITFPPRPGKKLWALKHLHKYTYKTCRISDLQYFAIAILRDLGRFGLGAICLLVGYVFI